MLTVIGEVVRPDGHTLQADALGNIDSVAWVAAKLDISDQPAGLGVFFDHDTTWRLGTVGALVRGARLGLTAVATLDADVGSLLEDGPWYWSDSITCKRQGDSLHRTDAVLRELSLVRHTGNCGTKPVVCVPGDISTATAAQPRHMPMSWDVVWKRAAQDMPGQRYRRSSHTTIVDLDGGQKPAPPAPADPGEELSGSSMFGRPLTRAMANVVIAALSDPKTEHLPVGDRLYIGAVTHRR